MKIGLIASFLIHVGGLAMVPHRQTPPTGSPADSVATSCRCDYEFTITDGRPPRALTVGEIPAHRFAP